MTEKLLTGNQVAEILNISRSTAYNLMKRGQLPSVRFGRSVRCRSTDLDEFIVNNLTTDEVSTFSDNSS